MNNKFILIPLCLCIWILSIAITHFYTATHYEKKWNKEAILAITQLHEINQEIINLPVISKQNISNNSIQLQLAMEISKKVDFSFNYDYVQAIYKDLYLINQIIDSNYNNHSIYSYLDKQHFNFIQTYLSELDTLLTNSLTEQLKANKFTTNQALINLLETTTSYYNQYK